MLEGLVTWILNTYFGKYVENLNTDQLSIALLQGEVELENLPLKKNALRTLGLPLQINAGLIGKVKLQIPVRQFHSAPWVIVIEQLYVVAGPVKLDEFNQDAEEKAAQEYKMSLLDAIEAKWRAETQGIPDNNSLYYCTYSSWMSYGTGLVTNIVDNLQLTIHDVHIRFEDDVSIPNQKFALGITVESLTTQSCDDNWLPKFGNKDAGSVFYKLMELNMFAIYWDQVKDDQFPEKLCSAEYVQFMQKYSYQKHSYILAPVSAQAHMKHDRSPQPLRSRTLPRFACDLVMEQVPLSLIDRQYGQIVGCLKGLQTLEIWCKFRQWRPELVKDNYQAWWHYMARCHGWKPHVKLTWDAILERARQNVKYVTIYSRVLSFPSVILPTDLKQFKDDIEHKLSFEELKELREVAMRRVKIEQLSSNNSFQGPALGKRVLYQWFPQWWGWYTQPSNKSQTDASQELEGEILDVLASSIEDNTILKRDTVFGQFNFTLHKGTFHLCSAQENANEDIETKLMMELQFKNVHLLLETRPRTSSHKFSITVGGIYLRDHLTPDSMFPVLICPQTRDSSSSVLNRISRQYQTKLIPQNLFGLSGNSEQPLFALFYEYRPFDTNTDHKLKITTSGLDVVFNPTAVQWFSDFFTQPHHRSDGKLRQAARHKYEAMKQRTKKELIRNWEQILSGDLTYRKCWEVDLDISAPQIIFAEKFSDKNGIIVIVDFGKLIFSTHPDVPLLKSDARDSEDEDEYQTPCGTPPASDSEDVDPDWKSVSMSTAQSPKSDDDLQALSQSILFHKLYDRYKMEFCDLQILVGKARDNWKYAHHKGTSTLHVLDRFNISLTLERRVAFTADPLYPSLAISGHLPNLVIHLNEQKVAALHTIIAILKGKGLPSPFRSQAVNEETIDECVNEIESSQLSDIPEEKMGNELSRLLMLQFSLDKVCLEVQSRGRSVAEFQVFRVHTSFTKKTYDTNISLSVHGLLLVDALQTFGPDFELLVASHKHVVMDSISGSLKDSEPTSPISPGSPDPSISRSYKPTCASALTQALSSLQSESSSIRAKSPTIPSITPIYPTSPNNLLNVEQLSTINLEASNADALITIDITLVGSNCPANEGETVQIASIQFNTLNIIANQETIVELIGFSQCVFPWLKNSSQVSSDKSWKMSKGEGEQNLSEQNNGKTEETAVTRTRTEISFDFIRLNVLLLRAISKDGIIVGRKVATATMCEAKIQASQAQDLVIKGSLGGLQVLDLTPEGHKHQRILSVGKDPLAERFVDPVSQLDSDMYSMGGQTSSIQSNDAEALSFYVKRIYEEEDPCCLEIDLQMASVWYTHSPNLLSELQSCASEFKHYLSNLARSIKTAATEMALGLVHGRVEALAHGLYLNSRMGSSFYGGSSSELSTPKRQRQNSGSTTADLTESFMTARGSALHTPFSPNDDYSENYLNFKVNITLNTPVIVLPRSSRSSQVFVAHLGNISIANSSCPVPEGEAKEEYWGMSYSERFMVQICDMKLYSLDIEGRIEEYILRADQLYNCQNGGKPVLHDIVIRITIDRNLGRNIMHQSGNYSFLDGSFGGSFQELEKQDQIQITAKVLTPLKVSLTRDQYEQLIDSVNYILSSSKVKDESVSGSRMLKEIEEESEKHTGVSTLNLDPALRARLRNVLPSYSKTELQHTLMLKINIDIRLFIMELKGDLGSGEQSLVELTLEQLGILYDKGHHYETSIQMSIYSLCMEDLTQHESSKYRRIASSVATPHKSRGAAEGSLCLSESCSKIQISSDNIGFLRYSKSLPDRLVPEEIFGVKRYIWPAGKFSQSNKQAEYPCTPPPSPRAPVSSNLDRDGNLVHVNVVLVDKCAPNFASHYNSIERQISVDINSLDVVVKVDSWVVILDFFGIASNADSELFEELNLKVSESDISHVENQKNNRELSIDVRSLTVMFIGPDYELAKANISNLNTNVSTRPLYTCTTGRLGSMSLLDLSPSGYLYKERFVTSGQEALKFNMTRYGSKDPDMKRMFDSCLKLEMSSVMYVHTKRFIAEIQAFFRSFTHLQTVVNSIRLAASGGQLMQSSTRCHRLLLDINAGSPVILLPVSSCSSEILVGDLGTLRIKNRFQQSPQTSSGSEEESSWLLDVMQIELLNMDLYAGTRESSKIENHRLCMGSYNVSANGPSLLKEKCHLQLKVVRNLESEGSCIIPDLAINGTLSALNCAVDLSQYKLIRGLLSYNLGEITTDIQTYLYHQDQDYFMSPDNNEGIRPVLSISLELLNVTVKLQLKHETEDSPELSLAAINFIKSRFLLEIMSDGTQDIDLASQEILLTDTRFEADPVNKRANVFTNIVQPITMDKNQSHSEVQAEIHHRQHRGNSLFTILLKDMRLMAICDWWRAVRDFITVNIDNPFSGKISSSLKNNVTIHATSHETATVNRNQTTFELKLNVTCSEVVVVEDTAIWDTNAVILKSNSVIVYRPELFDKPLSCELYHCELFSCILGMEDETALSIIDPVLVSIEIIRKYSHSGCVTALNVHTKDLTVRVSYHDMCMFVRILNSLSRQTVSPHCHCNDDWPANRRNQIIALRSLGFRHEDCVSALNASSGNLNDAALWLTQHAATYVPEEEFSQSSIGKTLSYEEMLVEAACVCIVVIDDCRDADVPLLELTLSKLSFNQFIDGSGSADCQIICDYYNRTLSGWEPFIEQWRCEVKWQQILQSVAEGTHLSINVMSVDVLNINVTSTLVKIFKMVKENWTSDYDSMTPRQTLCEISAGKSMNSPPGYRRRLPFVPYAVCNNTGSRLWFKTYISNIDRIEQRPTVFDDDSWVLVTPGATVPFTFEGRGKIRHRNTHLQTVHQLGVKVEGWMPVTPITVDKVGVYFRHTMPEHQSVFNFEVPSGRIVFEVKLEGSAKKIITVRSALLLINKLYETIEAKFENVADKGSKSIKMSPNDILPVPLSHVMSLIWIRPLCDEHIFQYCNKAVMWNHVNKRGEVVDEIRECIGKGSQCYSFRFYISIQRENYPVQRHSSYSRIQPAHSIYIVSPLSFTNLLPYDLHFKMGSTSGYIKPNHSRAFHEIDPENSFEVSFTLESFPNGDTITVPGGNQNFTARIKVSDYQDRSLYLNASVYYNKGSGIEVFVYASYWIFNKTGMPLIFKQESCNTEAGGQFKENEVARMVAPLLFSIIDNAGSSAMTVRVGKMAHMEGTPMWSQPFHLQCGFQVRTLGVSLRNNTPDIVYEVGISTRMGRGQHRDTTIVTISSRYQLHNKSKHKLQFSQTHFATTVNDPGAEATHLSATQDSCLSFHWPRLDKELLLSVRLLDVPNCLWSGGFHINSNDSLYINIRNAYGTMHFLHVEVILQEATYHVIFTDADNMPPPMRIDNLSEVAIRFYQNCGGFETPQTKIQPHSSLAYAWDEPTKPGYVTLRAPGGVMATYHMNTLGDSTGLSYENFIYIAFTETFTHMNSHIDPLDIHGQQLVLDVPHGTRVVLAQKQHGCRSQLWRMTSEGQLQHEGSSPPGLSDKSNIMILDIAGPAPQPLQYVPLALHRPDKRRVSTQTWRFTKEGRLCCSHNNMCVQAKDGFFGLNQGNEVVIGPPYARGSEVPLEQAICRQRLRPGSGFLSVKIQSDGPTRVLQIKDITETVAEAFATVTNAPAPNDKVCAVAESNTGALEPSVNRKKFQIQVLLKKGLGVSIVSRIPLEELMFLYFNDIDLVATHSSRELSVSLKVKEVQCDNQLFEAQCPVVLYTSTALASWKDDQDTQALELTFHKISGPNPYMHIFKSLQVKVNNVILNIEELFLLKLFSFAGYNHMYPEQEAVDEEDAEAQHIITASTCINSSRYYFGSLSLQPNQIRLSVITTNKLPCRLRSIKRKLSLRLIRFEDAAIDLEPYLKTHLFENGQFLMKSIIKHFKDELKWQAASILGSVDFLGNPLGLVSDVSDGVSGLIFEGNISALFKNVTHGLSNSAAKVTESLGDGLGRVILDDHHEETRQRIRKVGVSTSGDHIVAGLKGLGFGLLGGVTSVFKLTYEGASTDGMPGFISGLGKGLVGTVTKPIVGVLDLASETASAVRDSSRSSNREVPSRVRPTRCVTGIGGLLPMFDLQQSRGQEFLYKVNQRDYSELFIIYQCLLTGSEDLRIIVTSEMVRVFSCNSSGHSDVLTVALSDISECKPWKEVHPNGDTTYYIELSVCGEFIRRPRIRCKDESVSKQVSFYINIAKNIFEERKTSLVSSGDSIYED